MHSPQNPHNTGGGTGVGTGSQPGGSGTISSTPFAGITNQPHSDFTSIDWVPAWMIPSYLGLFCSILGVVGGVFFGAGLQPQVSIADLPIEVIQMAARTCGSDIKSCNSLRIASTSAPMYFYFWIGLVFLLIYIVGSIAAHRMGKKSGIVKKGP